MDSAEILIAMHCRLIDKYAEDPDCEHLVKLREVIDELTK
jgi:hypothetical protein